jgi:hypothetical protein
VTRFSDIYSTPRFGLSLRGDICFYNTTDGNPALNKQRRFFLHIFRVDGSTLQAPLLNPPALIEGFLNDGISCLPPQIVNDNIYLVLTPDWMYGLNGPSQCVKMDWKGEILWVKEVLNTYFECVFTIITPTGRQYLLFEHGNKKTLMFISDDGEVLWTLHEKWLNKLAPWMYSLPDECVLLAEATTKPTPGGALSKLYVVGSDGKVIKRNDFLQTAARNCIDSFMPAYHFYQSPVCPPQKSLIYFSSSLPYWGFETPRSADSQPERKSIYFSLVF